MSLDIGKISDLYKASSIDKDTREKTEKTGRVSMAEYFMEETKIQSAENTGDIYDRGRKSKGIDEEKLVLNEEMLKQLGDVVNADNYAKYEELGIIPDQDDPTSILTVSERIEIELATHCDSYKASGNISISDLESMYGSSGRAYQVASRLNNNDIYPEEELVKNIEQALEKIDSIKSVNREASEYLLTNNKSITIENVYKAVYSVADVQSTTYEKLSDTDWANLQGQVQSTIENMGFEANEETMADARWLVESRIPLNSENIYKLSMIRDINSQINNPSISENDWIDKLSRDTMFLGIAESSSMDFYKTVEGDSIEAVTIIQNGTSDQINELLMDGKEVTLLNLKKVQDERSKSNQQIRSEMEYEDKDNARRQKFITAQRTLEEARIKMSVEAGAMLIRGGFELNVASLTDIVDKLKEMENQVAGKVFESIGHTATNEDLEIYSDSVRYMKDLSTTNAYVLGNVYKQEIEFTVIEVVNEGKVNEGVLKAAYEAYDLLGTKPDKALGDSINKAFEGIDGILDEMGLETDELNSRAVRILAYNQIEITEENIQNIRALDEEVTRLMNNLSPKMTAYLIANGINPLNTNISKLNDELEDLKEQIGYDDEVEKYSEYLWKLQKNDEISEEDKEAYTGIYRLLNMIEKGDRRALGAVAKQEGDLTLSNLLAASRSLKKTGKEYVVDDEMGITDTVTLAENNISNQLEKLLQGAESSNNLNENYYAELNDIKSREIENLKYISEETLSNLFEDGTERNMSNILGISYIMSNGGDIYSKIKKVCEDEDVDSDIEDLSKTIGEDISEENEENVLKEKIEQLGIDVKEALINKSEITLEDVRQVNGALKYMTNAMDSQSYYVPMEFEGEQTLVKFTLKKDEEKRGTIGIKIYGNTEIEAKIRVTESKVKIVETSGIEDNDTEKIQNKLSEMFEESEAVLNNNSMIKIAKAFIFEINNNAKMSDI